LQVVDAGAGADDVDDGVEGADFVEVDLVAGGVVDLGFGIGEAGEGGDGGFFDGVGEGGVLDDGGDVGEVAMGIGLGGLDVGEGGAEGAFHDLGGVDVVFVLGEV
jgi:hypothetical protein